MNEKLPRVNSQEYWEERFAGNWDAEGGPQQTRFFAQLALRMLPRWLSTSFASCESLLDVGCAEGEAVASLGNAFPGLSLTGMDFSAQAIKVAQERHPGARFIVGDIARIEEKFDIVFCSNVLEHFHDPLTMLERLVASSRRYVVVMVPGWETERHHEHHVTFGLDSFPLAVADKHCVHLGAVNCARIDSKQWPGYQILAVYAPASVLGDSKLTVGDSIRSAHMPGLGIADLAELRVTEPALERIGYLASASMYPPGDAAPVLDRLAQFEQRQEQIGFNTRLEIAELVADVGKKVDSAQLEKITSLGAELEATKQSAEKDSQELQETRNRLNAVEERFAETLAARQTAEEQLQKANAQITEVAKEGQRRLDTLEERYARQLTALEEQSARQLKAVEQQEDPEVPLLKASISDLENALQAWKLYAGDLDADRRRLAEGANHLVGLLQQTHLSTSWSLTAPVRWLSTTLLGRGEPPEVPSATDFAVQELKPPSGADLEWDEFSERVLARRDQYRGIFIQEVAIDWNVPLYQRPQHMATAFARIGYLVIYVSYNWGGDDVDGFREIADNIWLSNRYEVNTIPGAIRSVYSTAYAHTPEALSERPDDSIFVYEYIDHIDPQISGAGETVAKLLHLKQWAFEGGADLIVASAKVLQAEAEAESTGGAAKVVSVPNGVDTRHYRHSKHDRYSLDPALVDFCSRGPVVGYFGAIAPWLWYDALGELISARPDLQFVFIGPDYHGGVERLPTGDNVLYLGAIDYQVLPAYGRLFDVCLIPFAPGEIARTTSPLKLFEYFALEKPVVVTSEMVECVAYPEVFRGTDAQGLSKAIDAALGVKDSPEFQRRLRELADENDWDRRAEVLALAVESFRQ